MKRFLSGFCFAGLIAAGLAGSGSAVAEPGQPGGKLKEAWSQADAHYGKAEMAAARAKLRKKAGGEDHYMVMADRFETQLGDDDDLVAFEGSAWFGGDINKALLKAEAAYSLEETSFDGAEVQTLWSRAVSPFFDIQSGLRFDLDPDSLVYGVIGFQGVAPYWFELDGALFFSEEGDFSARLEAEYELLLTQRLILQPRAEVDIFAQDVQRAHVGAGVSEVHAGLRLRYEVTRSFAPFIGVEWQSHFGETRTLVRLDGEDTENAFVVLGVRAWY